MKFFKMWWDEQSFDKQEQVRNLVYSGQLEILNAGWSMHDEACPTYEDMLANMMVGQEWYFTNFAQTPRIGWQVDPFGHSNTNARLFHDLGLDAYFFARMDQGELDERIKNKELEWIQKPNNQSFNGENVEIFTHYIYGNLYFSPDDFEYNVDDIVFRSNESSPDFNAEAMTKKFDAFIKD